MALDFTASEISAMKHHFFTRNFKEVLKIANISWDLQNLRKPTLEEVYLSDAVFLEEVAELEIFLLNRQSSDFCNQVIEYLSSVAIRQTIIFSEIKSNDLKSSVIC